MAALAATQSPPPHCALCSHVAPRQPAPCGVGHGHCEPSLAPPAVPQASTVRMATAFLTVPVLAKRVVSALTVARAAAAGGLAVIPATAATALAVARTRAVSGLAAAAKLPRCVTLAQPAVTRSRPVSPVAGALDRSAAQLFGCVTMAPPAVRLWRPVVVALVARSAVTASSASTVYAPELDRCALKQSASRLS